MRDDQGKLDLLKDGGDLSFAAFTLKHAECGEDSVTELRLGERSLMAWCPSCAAVEIFGSLDLP